MSRRAKDIAVKEPKSTGKIVEAIEKDVQFLLGKLVISAMIQSTEFSIEGAGEDPRAVALAENLRQQFEDALPNAIECFGHGRQAFEKWACYDPATKINQLGGLDPISFRHSEMILDERGQFAGIKFTAKGRSDVIDKDSSWWCALDATPEHPHGRSRYVGAPIEIWKARRQLDINEKDWQKRFALGHGFAKAPQQYPPDVLASMGVDGQTYKDGRTPNPITDMEEAILALGSGGVAVMPSGNYPAEQGGASLFEYQPPQTRQDAAPLENQRRVLDAYALRSLGVPERAVTQDDATGSYSMAEVHWKVLASTCEGILSQIVASFQEQVIDFFIGLNWLTGKPKLELKYEPIVNTSKPAIIELVKTIVAQPTPSMLVTEGVLDLEKLLQVAGIPAGEDILAKMEVIAEQSAAASTPPPQGPFGFSRRLAIDPKTPTEKPPTEDWEAYAEKASAQAAKIMTEIKLSLGSNPSDHDRRRLRQGDTGVPPPARKRDSRKQARWTCGPMEPDSEKAKVKTTKGK